MRSSHRLLTAVVACMTVTGAERVGASRPHHPAGRGHDTQDMPASGAPQVQAAGGPVTPYDLLTITDIATMTLSPDGSQLAFVTRRAALERNDYDCDLYVIDMPPGAAPRRLGSVSSHMSLGSGFVSQRVKWSGDAKTLTYLSTFDGVQQVWAWPVEGGPKRRVSNATIDVVSHDILPDGRTVFYSVMKRAGTAADAGALTRQAYREGMVHRFPQRWSDYSGDVGVDRYVGRLLGAEFEHAIADLETGTNRPATAADLAPFPTGFPGADEIDSERYNKTSEFSFAVASPRGPGKGGITRDRKRTARIESDYSKGQIEAVIKVADGHGAGGREWYRTRASVTSLHWDPAGEFVYFEETRMTDRGPASGIYRLKEGLERPEELFSTTGTIEASMAQIGERVSYDPEVSRAVFLLSGPAQPPRIVALDLRTKQLDVLFDPNPWMADRRLPKATLLAWKNRYGVRSFGYLVEPARQAGRKAPLVVVTYSADGFLRGGSDDLVPVFPLASMGFAVLVMDAGEPYVEVANEGDDFTVFSRWRSGHATVEEAVRQAGASEFVDTANAAVTGFSYGATIAWYSLFRSNLFRAAIVADGGMDPGGFYLRGPALERWPKNEHVFGVPPVLDRDLERWSEVGTSQNAGRIRAPILINEADTEFWGAIQTYTTLSSLGKPYELVIYPNMGHNVNRPAARYSIYQRNIDWLRFWLQDVVDPAPEKKEQYQRWAVMKEQRDWNEKQLRDGKDATAEFVRQLRAGTSRTEQPSDGLAPMIREKTVHRPR